jgi:hypothetical protein
MWATEVPWPPTTLTLVWGQISRHGLVDRVPGGDLGLDFQDLGRLTAG